MTTRVSSLACVSGCGHPDCAHEKLAEVAGLTCGFRVHPGRGEAAWGESQDLTRGVVRGVDAENPQ